RFSRRQDGGTLKVALTFLVVALVVSQCFLEYAVRKTQSVMENRLAACEAVLRRTIAIAMSVTPTETKTTRHFVGAFSHLGRAFSRGDFPKAFYSRFKSSGLQVRRYSEPRTGNDDEWDWTLEVKETGPDSYSIVATYGCPNKGCFAMCEYTV